MTEGSVLPAELDGALQAIDELDALGTIAEMLLEAGAGGGRELTVELPGEHREDLAAVAVGHERDSTERK